MTEKLEELLAAEFRDGPYDLPADADRLTATARRRRSRRTVTTAAAAVCGVALAATAGVGLLDVFTPGPGTVESASSAPATALAPTPSTVAPERIGADSVRLGDAVLRGLPATAELDAGATSGRPPVAVLPRTGDRAVLSVPAGGSTRTQLAVVVGAEDRPGLPGVPDAQDWFGSLGGAQALLTVDDSTETTYLTMNTPAGLRWHLAATGPDASARLTLLQAVAVATATAR